MDARPSGSQSAQRRETSSPGASIPDKSPRRRGDEGLQSPLIGRARENDPGSTRDTQVTLKPGTLRPNVSFPDASLGGRRRSAAFVAPADWPKGETEHEPHTPERKVPRCESPDTHNAGKPDHHQDHGISPRTEDKNFQRLLGGFMVALFVGLSLLVLGVLFSLHIVRGAPLTLTPGPWCTSDGCLQQAGYLQRSANTSVQPCQDFYSFVCHNWAPNRHSHQVEYIADVPAEMRNHWRLKNAALLFNGSLGPPSFERASAVFKACILRTEKDKTSDLEKFKKIMRDAGIPWPDDPSSEKHPLAVLLDLDANLGAPVWFKKTPLQPKPQQPSQSLDPADGRCGDPGLEVAFQAYAQDSHHRSEGGLVLHNTSYSPDQVFFLSLARGVCGLPAASMNDMLKNFKPFADAFECDSNSTMGGQRHCTFF
ncbi:hypothetical protein HPB47_023301 [Ixodes persulcatus]|uniref:Uncharacterized protein n=1 Tax=Ixodes persulcatus TaxID=34615 RepID=A0AC60Q9E7_IXOPE|nr:hypothetical protein HPB47_023301 [Ixodes persulcatus]